MPGGAFTAKVHWLLYAEIEMAPFRRKFTPDRDEHPARAPDRDEPAPDRSLPPVAFRKKRRVVPPLDEK